MTILGLDVGNHTGWARSGDRVTGTPTSGTVDFTPKAGDLAGVRWSRFNDWLATMLDAGPELVVYERWTRGLGDAPKIRAGFITRIEERCDALGIERLEVSPAELKLWLTGNGRASKDLMREAVLNTANRAPDVDAGKWTARLAMPFDEADALALLHFALAKGT